MFGIRLNVIGMANRALLKAPDFVSEVLANAVANGNSLPNRCKTGNGNYEAWQTRYIVDTIILPVRIHPRTLPTES